MDDSAKLPIIVTSKPGKVAASKLLKLYLLIIIPVEEWMTADIF